MIADVRARFWTLIAVSVLVVLAATVPLWAQADANPPKTPVVNPAEFPVQSEIQAADKPAPISQELKETAPSPKPAVVTPAKSAAAAPARVNPPAPKKVVVPQRTEAPAAAAQTTNAAVAPEIPAPPPVQATSREQLTQAKSAESDPLPAVPGSGWADLVKLVGSVGLIVCLILAGFVLVRRYAPQYLIKNTGARSLKLIETLSIGDRRSIAIVQAGTQRFLIANATGQITLLTALPDSGAVAKTSEIEHAGPPDPFSDSFRNVYEQEKRVSHIRPAPARPIPPDIRGKMQELRKALEG